MIKGYKVCLIPTKEQEEKLWQHVHAARAVWNWGLRYQMDRFKNGEKYMSAYDLAKVLTQLKKTEEYAWFNNVSSRTLICVLQDLGVAYNWFFKLKPMRYTKKKKEKAKRCGKQLTFYDFERYPKFKDRDTAIPKFPTRNETVYFANECVNIEKIGKIAYQTDRKLPQGIVRNAKWQTIPQVINPRIKFVNGKWILCFGIECESQAPTLTNKSLGIDLGIKDLAVASFDGEKIVFNNINKSKRMRTLEEKKKHLQRKRSRQRHINNKHYGGKMKKSKNILKTEKILKRTESKMTNKRKDYTHKVTRKLVNLLPKRVVMEDLDTMRLMKNKHLSKKIKEQNWYDFRKKMEYKCEFFGIEFVLADQLFPSTQICSVCGKRKKLALKDRIYECGSCKLVIDRDYNAAVNLMNYKGVNHHK